MFGAQFYVDILYNYYSNPERKWQIHKHTSKVLTNSQMKLNYTLLYNNMQT